MEVQSRGELKASKREALNCIENLLVREEICIDKYELLNKIIDLLDSENSYDLKEGYKIMLVECK